MSDPVLKEFGFPVVEGGFGTLLADPPWSFSDKGSRAAPDWKGHKLYETMSAEDILRLPVDLLTAPASHLYLWTTDVHLSLALSCIDAWGFTFKKSIAWVKRRCETAPVEGEAQVLRGPLQIGMGHYFRTAKELCLFATRGKAPAAVHNLPDVFEAPRTQHSRKPDTVHEWAEKLSPGPRLELFARRSREGWAGWGDQFPGHAEYLRLLEKIGARRAGFRSKRQENADRRRAQVCVAKMQKGFMKWPARCGVCRGPIAQGDTALYSIDTPAKCCLPCAVDLEAAESAPVPF